MNPWDWMTCSSRVCPDPSWFFSTSDRMILRLPPGSSHSPLKSSAGAYTRIATLHSPQCPHSLFLTHFLNFLSHTSSFLNPLGRNLVILCHCRRHFCWPSALPRQGLHQVSSGRLVLSQACAPHNSSRSIHQPACRLMTILRLLVNLVALDIGLPLEFWVSWLVSRISLGKISRAIQHQKALGWPWCDWFCNSCCKQLAWLGYQMTIY